MPGAALLRARLGRWGAVTWLAAAPHPCYLAQSAKTSRVLAGTLVPVVWTCHPLKSVIVMGSLSTTWPTRSIRAGL